MKPVIGSAFGRAIAASLAVGLCVVPLLLAGCGGQAEGDYTLTKQGASALGLHAVAFEGNGEIYLASAGGIRKLTSATAITDAYGEHPYVAASPTISPTGAWIAYIRRTEDDPGDVFLVDPSGSTRRRLTDQGDIENASWNRTGTALAVATSPGLTFGLRPGTKAWKRALDREREVFLRGGLSRAFSTDIVRVGMPSGRMTRLTRGPAEDSSPAWSPDGRWVAFVRTPPHARSRKPTFPPDEIWLASATGTDHPFRVLKDGYTHFGLVWSKDSNTLYADRSSLLLPRPSPALPYVALTIHTGRARGVRQPPDPTTTDGALSATLADRHIDLYGSATHGRRIIAVLAHNGATFTDVSLH